MLLKIFPGRLKPTYKISLILLNTLFLRVWQ